MSIISKIESLLFVSIRPFTVKQLMEKTEVKKKEEIESAIEELIKKYNNNDSGVTLQRIDDKVQFVTSADNSKLITDFLKEEVTGELTPASLETLTVIAYRGPISKPELELIRGVNCSLILRNLMIRGLVEEKKDKDELASKYQITFDFLKHLGLASISELVDYNKLNSDENLKQLLNNQTQSQTTEISNNTPVI